ncbi:NAD-dependent epimerase/dehydratase family protein [Phenylobacterium sp.]|uniref:NAD-dependent epimerase/dehydratase family protein n=1 Tax=Phenylobacterium sp. TaxID=1871053 RepID=UPI002C44CFCF|nr:NAD-dependent epimerase/dehydratase family protein [Phenylobacterium sp.]HVI30649.1 NAD-dependent epimerase/dehydratase family protein [Phenylobacterium sp.]
MKRVLVAGGLGFIGSHLVDRLLKRADVGELTVVDNLWTGLRDNLDHPADERLRIVIGDIERAPLSGRFDEIYHLASPASPPWYMAEPLRTISANVLGAMRCLELLEPGGQLAYTSTSEVYGDPLVSPQPESYRGSVDCTGPRAAYDESKRCVEAMLFEARRTRGVRIKVVRLFNVFGPRTRMDDGRAVSNFVTQALRGLPITVYGDGSQTRSWGYVDDILAGLERYWWRDGVDYPGPLNVGNDREIPVLQVAEYIQRRFPGCEIRHLPPAPHDPTNRRPDLALAGQVIPGWTCAVPYEEGVDRTIAWFQARMAGATRIPEAPEPILLPAALVPELRPAARRRRRLTAGVIAWTDEPPPGAAPARA